MWVRLTAAGYNAVLRATLTDLAMSEAFTSGAEPARIGNPSTKYVDVYAPYVAWYNVRETFRGRIFGPRGGRTTKTPDSTYNAFQRITKELNYHDAHPALKGKAMLGWIGDLLPVWLLDDERKYSLYPKPGAPFRILTPVWIKSEAGKATRWVERESGEGRIADEEFHLALWRHPVA